MDRVRLEPSSLARAIEAVELRLPGPTVHHVCAALETSRGLALLGSPTSTGRLAQAIAEVAQESGFAAGLLRLSEPVAVEAIVERLQLGSWLFVEELSVHFAEPLVQSLAHMLDLRDEPRTIGGWAWSRTWRLLVAFEPTVEQRLPPIPVQYRRHFPHVEVREVS